MKFITLNIILFMYFKHLCRLEKISFNLKNNFIYNTNIKITNNNANQIRTITTQLEYWKP